MEKKVKLKNSDASIVAFALTLVFLFIILIGLILNPGESPILGLLMFGTWFSSLIMAVIDIRKPSRKKTLSILTLIIDLGAIVLFLFVMMLTIVGMMSLL